MAVSALFLLLVVLAREQTEGASGAFAAAPQVVRQRRGCLRVVSASHHVAVSTGGLVLAPRKRLVSSIGRRGGRSIADPYRVDSVAARRRPWLLVGWLWFVVGLLPVIGLGQGGDQAWADRFTYWPHIGLFVAAVWGLSEVVERLHIPTAACGVAAALVVGCCGALTWIQVGYWHDPEALWNQTLSVSATNHLCTATWASTTQRRPARCGGKPLRGGCAASAGERGLPLLLGDGVAGAGQRGGSSRAIAGSDSTDGRNREAPTRAGGAVPELRQCVAKPGRHPIEPGAADRRSRVLPATC